MKTIITILLICVSITFGGYMYNKGTIEYQESFDFYKATNNTHFVETDAQHIDVSGSFTAYTQSNVHLITLHGYSDLQSTYSNIHTIAAYPDYYGSIYLTSSNINTIMIPDTASGQIVLGSVDFVYNDTSQMISGTWFCGSEFDIFVRGNPDIVSIVPEPMTLLILGSGSLFLIKRRK